MPSHDYQLLSLALNEENISRVEKYDLVVLGSGRGRFFAWSMASQGKRAAVIERR
jgi:hypothetical protein